MHKSPLAMRLGVTLRLLELDFQFTNAVASLRRKSVKRFQIRFVTANFYRVVSSRVDGWLESIRWSADGVEHLIGLIVDHLNHRTIDASSRLIRASSRSASARRCFDSRS